MYIEKEEFGKALKGALLTAAAHPRLTEDGENVIEYGLEKVLNHPELSTDQQIVAILEYVPEQLKAEHGDRLNAASPRKIFFRLLFQIIYNYFH